MRANTFFVDIVGGNPIVTSGLPVVKTESGWAVPLGECFNCGTDMFLSCSASNPPEVVTDGGDQTKGQVLNASIIGDKMKKLRRPDASASDLKAIVMLGHFDELEQSEGAYEVIKEGTGVALELYRGSSVKFRCPQGIDRYELSFDGVALKCRPLSMVGQPEGEPTQADLASSVPSLS